MLYKPLLGDQLSGSVGGITASRNRYGTYFRQRSSPVNPATNLQNLVRSIFTDLTSAWNEELSDNQILGWEDYAFNSPIINRIGELITLTGQVMYIRNNTARIYNGLARIDDPPQINGIPGTNAGNPTALDSTTDQVTYAFQSGNNWANETGGYQAVYIARPQNPTIFFFKGPWQKLGTILGDDTTPPTSPATFTAPFNFGPGDKVFTRVNTGRADGRLSAATFPPTILAT